MRSETLYDRLSTLADVEQLIAMPMREGDTVEYKRASEPLTQDHHADVARDVSAFANAAGGTIVYGVATDRSDKTLPVRIEHIDPANIETIMKVIAARVRHPVSG